MYIKRRNPHLSHIESLKKKSFAIDNNRVFLEDYILVSLCQTKLKHLYWDNGERVNSIDH